MLVPSPPSTSGTSSRAEVDAAARPAHPLEAGDDPLAARAVLQEDAELACALLALLGVDDLEAWM